MKNNLIKVQKHNIRRIKAAVIAAALCVAFIIALIFTFPYIKEKIEEYRLSKMVVTEFTDEELYDMYVGPEDCEDRGEWMDPISYYPIYDEDGTALGSAHDAMFANADKKGIVPCGLMLGARLLTYDDFEPYDDIADYGFMDVYSCEYGESDVEVQLGIDGDMLISGGYEIEQDDCIYSADINLTLSGIYYYLSCSFDPDNMSVGGDEQESSPEYSYYLDPNFGFDYEGCYEAEMLSESADSGSDIISSSFFGSLDGSQWKFTTNISGQENEIFPQGEVYIRCEIPCTVEKSVDGELLYEDSHVTLYLKISEVRIGTRLDCMPDYLLKGDEESTELDIDDASDVSDDFNGSDVSDISDVSDGSDASDISDASDGSDVSDISDDADE